MRAVILLALVIAVASGRSFYPNGAYQHKIKDLNELLYRLRGVATKRCANLFSEGCSSGGLTDSLIDEEYLANGSPGKRCTNLFTEGCSNGGLTDSLLDEDYLNNQSPGRR
ncbi:uncharacterized protein LOC108735936 [Agrilus planipennis]|uniref:Uncharacterized protein LOC108735936 n=1 Tax=Agrilus planipennis TaxID=224129 RepID=A0A1W4WIA4_AGRPL|nr:uncharacterized protein LOC108735936 [Agrilus planipennis]